MDDVEIDENQVIASSVIPGKDWTGTPYEKFFTHACNKDVKASAMFFGLILWHVVMEHEECWGFGRYKVGRIQVEGLTYFRIDEPIK